MRGSLLAVALVGSPLLASLPALADAPALPSLPALPGAPALPSPALPAAPLDASSCQAALLAAPLARAGALRDAAVRVASARGVRGVTLVLADLDGAERGASDAAAAALAGLAGPSIAPLARQAGQAPGTLGAGVNASGPRLVAALTGVSPALLAGALAESGAAQGYAFAQLIVLGQAAGQVDGWTADPARVPAWLAALLGRDVPVAPAQQGALALLGAASEAQASLQMAGVPVEDAGVDAQALAAPLDPATRAPGSAARDAQEQGVVLAGHAVGDALTLAGLASQAGKAGAASLLAFPSQVPGCARGP